MKLSEVLKKVKPLEIVNGADVEITGVCTDSRKVKPGNLFVAVRGTQVDGHDFIAAAVSLGAAAVLMDAVIEKYVTDGVVFVRVANTEDAVGPVATTFFGDPSRHLKLVGVTGTNGKTTIATLLYTLFRKLGYKCGLCSTVCNYIDGEAVPADHTTPDPITLNELLARMVATGCWHAWCRHAVRMPSWR